MPGAAVDRESSPPRLDRVIGTGAVAATALNCIVGSGIFGLPGLAAAILGPAAILGYVVCAALNGLIGSALQRPAVVSTAPEVSTHTRRQRSVRLSAE